VDSSESVNVLRLVVSIAVLAYASVLDLRTRKVGNIYWVLLSVFGIVLLPTQLLIDSRPIEYSLVLVPVLAILSDVYWDVGEDSRSAKYAPAVKYAVSVVSIVLLGYLWVEKEYFQYLLAVPVFMLFIVAMYMLDVVRGGADAKALLALSIVFPFYPAIGFLPKILPEAAFAEIFFPFTFAVLVTAAVFVALLPIGFLVKNLTKKEFAFPYGLLGYKMDVGHVKEKHVWMMENIENGNHVLHTKPRKSEDLEKETSLLDAAGYKRVWVTPKIPFIVPMTASLVFTAVVGNFLFLFFK